MKIGIMAGGTPGANASLDGILTLAQEVETRGFETLWLAHIRSHDAVMALAYAGTVTERIELATAVTPIQPRHPVALAQQALSDRTTNAATCARHQHSAFDHGQSGQNINEKGIRVRRHRQQPP